MRNVFLTGATGTIGSALVPRLLAEPATAVVALVRARDDGALQARRDEMLCFWNYPVASADAGRVRFVRGDICEPGFGLQDADREQLISDTTHIIHCAASVKLNMTLDEARTTAVIPTRTVLDFGRRATASGVLRKIDLVSTVGVWGRTPGAMPERALPEVTDFHNTYESAKAEAERVVWAEGGGLPITVHRPSMVVGETGTGRALNFQVFYHLCEFLSGRRTFGIMPPLGSTRLDTIPVDFVADAINWASQNPAATGRILHLCSGPEFAIPLPQLQEQVRQAWAARGRRVPRLRWIERRPLERMIPIIGAFVGAKGRRALRALPPVLEYLAEDQCFSNHDTRTLLNAAGLPVPAPAGYLDAVLDFYLQSRLEAEKQ